MGLVTDHQNKANIAIKKKKRPEGREQVKDNQKNCAWGTKWTKERVITYAFGAGYKNQNH